MSAPALSARVAASVAAEQLAALGVEPAVRCEVDFPGPFGLDLPDETAVQAACGIMHVHGRASGRPEGLPVDYASTVAGVLAAQGVLAAEVARARGARVDAVRTSVAHAALLSVQQYLAVATAEDDFAEQHPAGGRPPLSTADGVRVEIETLNAEDWQRFWHALGAAGSAVARGWWPFQQRFATATCALPDALHEVVRAREFAEVRAAAADSGVSVLPVRADPSHPSGEPPCRLTPIPGRTSRALPEPRSLPLEGITAVESTRRVQGPVAGHVLRMLGADVVRVEPPGGDPMRGVPPMAGDVSARFAALNAGKRVVELDIKSPGDRARLRELVAGAEVFLHNWAPGKACQWGLDAADLARPGLVYAWASGWGEHFGTAPPLGTDFLAQAHSGLAAALADPPAPSLMTLTDVLGGLLCAQGVLAGLLRRIRTGEGSRVDSSLLSASGTIPRDRTPRSPYRTVDGFVAVPPDSTELARSCRGLPTAEWVERFAAAGVPATPVRTDLRALAADLGLGRPAFPPPPWEFS